MNYVVGVDYEEIEQIIKDLGNHLGSLKDNYKNYKDNAKFDKSEWSGPAAQMLNVELNKNFSGFIKNYISCVEQLYKELKTILKNYREVDRLVGKIGNGK